MKLDTEKQSAYERGAYDALDILSTAWHGKQYYFLEEDGKIYSRESGECISAQEAIAEFANRLSEET